MKVKFINGRADYYIPEISINDTRLKEGKEYNMFNVDDLAQELSKEGDTMTYLNYCLQYALEDHHGFSKALKVACKANNIDIDFLDYDTKSFVNILKKINEMGLQVVLVPKK